MKKTSGRIKKLTASAAISAAIIAGSVPVYAGDGQDSLSFLDDNNIPVVYITIDESAEGFGTIQEMNSSIDHSAKCTGTVRIDVPDGYTGDYSDEVLEDTDELQLEYMRGRGNVTWTADKKPYKIKLDKKAELLGMGKNKHWALLANRFDRSMIRNRVVSYIGEQMGFEYTPKMLPVDLVINGEYSGSYYLAETVRIAKSRVDIDELAPEDNSEPDINGGYLLALKPFFWTKPVPTENTFTTDHFVDFWFEEPEFYSEDGDEIGTPEQKNYISSYINKTEKAIMDEDFTDSDGTPYSDLMDVQSAVDFWWVQEFMLNEDAFDSSSNYLYKKRDGKLYWGPLWDFDFTMGVLDDTTTGFNQSTFLWLDRLRTSEPGYQQLLRERWDVLNDIITDVVKDGGVLDTYAEEIAASAQDDYNRWGVRRIIYNMEEDFDDEIEWVRSWLIERQKWVNDNIDERLTKNTNLLTFVDGDEVLGTLEAGIYAYDLDLPQAPFKEGKQFLSWCDDKNVSIYDYMGITNDVVLHPEYMDVSGPSEPSDVSEPSEPSDVSEPSEPSDVSEPSEPSDVSEPSEPSDVNEPSEPSDVSEPSEPSDVSEPSEPSDVSEPSEPSDVSEPSEPSDVSEPSEPSDVSEPSEPSDVSEPSEPSDVSEPSEPSDVSEPSEPSDVSEPSEPSGVSEPSEPSDVSEPSDTVPSNDVPATGEAPVLPFFVLAAALSMVTAVFTGKRKKS